MANYKGITFPSDFNMSFGDFKERFSSNHIFKEIPHKEREDALKKAHKIATNGNTNGEIKQGKETNTK